MKRLFAIALGLASATSAFAQVPPKAVTGVMIVRVKVGGGNAAVIPGGAPMPAGSADARSVVAAIPFKSLYEDVVYTGVRFSLQTNPRVFWISHDFAKTQDSTKPQDSGKTLLFTDASRIQLTPRYDLNTDVILKAKYTEWAKKKSPEGLFDLISLALGYDQVETAIKYCKELAALVEAKKDAAQPKRIADFLQTYNDLQSKFDETLPVASETAEWKKRLQAEATTDDKHYSIVNYGSQSVTPEAVTGKLAQLERNYKAFFLWHAVIGRPLPVPEKKQTVILAKRSTDLPVLRGQLEGSPIVSDSFYVASHNLVVLAPDRLDETGRTFLEMMKAEYDGGWNRENLLKGVPPKVSEKTPFGDIFRMSTNAVVDRAMELEANHGAISRECNRQLFASCGVVPQHVALPKWLDSGLSSLLAKPKNPGVIAGATPDKQTMVYGFAGGYGAPNYLMFREWKNMKAKQEIPVAADAKGVLLNVLNDSYFAAVRTGIDADKPAEAPPIAATPAPTPMGGVESTGLEIAAKTKLEMKAQATAWALMYFLTRERPDGMKKYCAELDKLPRDMRLGNKRTVEIFARCFDLMNTEKTEVDDAAFQAFATKWVGYLDGTQESWRDIPVEPTPNLAPPMGGVPIP